MLLELCSTFDIAHHYKYKGGLHSQSVLQAYVTMLECVYSPKSNEIDVVSSFLVDICH